MKHIAMVLLKPAAHEACALISAYFAELASRPAMQLFISPSGPSIAFTAHTKQQHTVRHGGARGGCKSRGGLGVGGRRTQGFEHRPDDELPKADLRPCHCPLLSLFLRPLVHATNRQP